MFFGGEPHWWCSRATATQYLGIALSDVQGMSLDSLVAKRLLSLNSPAVNIFQLPSHY